MHRPAPSILTRLRDERGSLSTYFVSAVFATIPLVGLVGDTSGREGTLARIVRIQERSSFLRRSADDTGRWRSWAARWSCCCRLSPCR